ncbi:hypothetical protein [Vibrio sp. D431a]|uniref:hypothetical protein n=1 Tax=Vibrio sp. D431a TaxID=2837388 RepID=UPI00255535BD|nr:hypothetical protein [Vibrio sp. D431a]MDK9793712.1 hypothetical protein [Vibrio sp. D431a]
MSIVEITSKISNKPLVKVTRELKAEDLVISFKEPSKSVEYVFGSSAYTVHGSIKTEVLAKIFDVVEPLAYANGALTSDCPFNLIAKSAGNSPEAKMFQHDYITIELCKRGLNKEKQQVKYDKKLKEAHCKASEQETKDNAVASLVAKINKALARAIDEKNKAFSRTVHMVVVDQNVSQEWFKSNMSETAYAELNAKSDEVDTIQAQIDALMKQRDEANKNVYNIKRAFVTEKLNDLFCEEGQRIVKEMEDKEKAPEFQPFFN